MTDVSIVVPTRQGGALLEALVDSIGTQAFDGRVETVLVDSGSSDEELERLRRRGVRIERIAPASFDHGATRDLGASLSSGRLLVFLNQDALPTDERWLATLVRAFDDERVAAVQGAILEFPAELATRYGRRRFFWDSCGPRFYFTSESEDWLRRYGGLGFSTVHCALRRAAWESVPFGRIAILEDKRWQKRAAESGLRITRSEKAAVWHTHDYDLASLWRRCSSEGFGWRLLGERYAWRTALVDLRSRSLWREWRHGIAGGSLRRPAEVAFPLLRPLALWWGNAVRRDPPRAA